MAKGMHDEEGTYQIWSSGSDDEEMQNPTHGLMFIIHEEKDEEKITKRCFVSTATHKSPMTS